MIEAIAEQVGIRVVDHIELPARQASLLPPPVELHEDVRAYLAANHPKDFYRHPIKASSSDSKLLSIAK